MEYLKSLVVGAPSAADSAEQQQNVADTVEKLVERVETSTLLEDRRDACRALKSLAKTFRLEVGAQAMDALVYVLQNDASDSEIVTYALDSLLSVICNEDCIESDQNKSSSSNVDLSVQFTEIFIKRKENVQLILDLLPEFDFKIRYPAIKLISGLLRNKLRDCQDCILTHPMGISRMMDLLIDPREVIRNDALLLLELLTKSNANIQKIVAFENAFDRILEIVSSEGHSDGGVVVGDCLAILLNLLKMNTSNQNFFKEGNYIQRLLPFFDIPFDFDWNSSSKCNNLLLMFQVIRALVSPSNPLQVTNSCQKVMSQPNGILQHLCTILLSNGIPASVLTETIDCVAEVIRANQPNQEYFSRVNAPIEPPRPVIVILLMSMINEKQPFELRCAVLYCFQSFLYKNELGQAQIVETLLPSDEAQDITAGQLLCGGFFSADNLCNWFVASALAHAVVHNATQKEQLLRVQLATDATSSPKSLLAFCSNLLQKGGHYQRRISLLMLLSMWLSGSSVAIANFLSIPTNIPFLTSQIGLVEGDEIEMVVQGLCAFLLGICISYNDNSIPSFTREDLCKIIQNRIGADIFAEKLATIAKNEKYSQALQKPYITYAKPDDVMFDYEFCNLFKLQEASILRVVQRFTSSSSSNGAAGGGDQANGPESCLTTQDHKLLVQYKELIREQDTQLISLRKQLASTTAENSQLNAQLHELQLHVQQLRDQIALMKVQQRSMFENQPSSAVVDPMSYVSSPAAVYGEQSSSIVGQPASSSSSSSYVMISNSANHVPANNNNNNNDNNNGTTDTSFSNGQPPMNNNNNYNGAEQQQFQQRIAQLTYELSVRDQNLQLLTNQLNSLQLYENNSIVSAAAGAAGTGTTVTTTTDLNQLEYLFNENRRLQSIIDQYKCWEANYYAMYSGGVAGGGGDNQAAANHTLESEQPASTEVNQNESQASLHISPDISANSGIEQQQQQQDIGVLRAELESLQSEHEDLITLLADQDLKMQKYVRQLKQLGQNVNEDGDELKPKPRQQQQQQPHQMQSQQAGQISTAPLPVSCPNSDQPQILLPQTSASASFVSTSATYDSSHHQMSNQTTSGDNFPAQYQPQPQSQPQPELALSFTTN